MKTINDYIDYIVTVTDNHLSLSGLAVTNMRTSPSFFIYLQDYDGKVFRGDGSTFETAAFKACLKWKGE